MKKQHPVCRVLVRQAAVTKGRIAAMDDRFILFSLIKTPGIGIKTIRKLYECNGGQWGDVSRLTRTEWDQIVDPRMRQTYPVWRRTLNASATEVAWMRMNALDRFVLTQEDPDYPELLHHIPDPPWMLFCRGDRQGSALQQPGIAIVGTRACTVYGKTVARKFAAGIGEMGWPVVSGLARGIDAHAHQGALDAKVMTIAVLAGGVDHVYPPEHQSLADSIVNHKGLLISEQPDGTALQAGLFPLRNRIIAGMTYGTIVVEAAEHSGSLITTALAAQYHREVFAVPGPVFSPKSQGPLALLAEGASIVRQVSDVLLQLAHTRKAAKPVEVKSLPTAGKLEQHEEQCVLEYLSAVPTSFAHLQEMTNYGFGQLHRVLLSLQMKNRIVQTGPSTYALI